jgi:hypothetical protein
MKNPHHGERIIAYRLDDLDPSLTRDVPPESPLRSRVFFIGLEKAETLKDLFIALPEPPMPRAVLDHGMRITHEMVLSLQRVRTFQSFFERMYEGFKAGFHAGDAGAVEAWLRASGCTLEPIKPLLDRLAFVELRPAPSAHGSRVMFRSHVVNAYWREALTPTRDGLFAFDLSNDDIARFSLYRSDAPFSYVTTLRGPGERSVDLEKTQLQAGKALAVELDETAPFPVPFGRSGPEVMAVATLSELDAHFSDGLAADSPLRSRLFWIGPSGSLSLEALFTTAPEGPFAHTRAGLDVMRRLEARVAELDTSALWPAGTPLEAGFRVADAEVARAWLQSNPDVVRCVSLTELLGAKGRA